MQKHPKQPADRRLVLYEMPPRRGQPPTGDVRLAEIVDEDTDPNGLALYTLRGIGGKTDWSAYGVQQRRVEPVPDPGNAVDVERRKAQLRERNLALWAAA